MKFNKRTALNHKRVDAQCHVINDIIGYLNKMCIVQYTLYFKGFIASCNTYEIYQYEHTGITMQFIIMSAII